MNAQAFNEFNKICKPSDVDNYYSLGNSYTSSMFDPLRARYALARQHYYDVLKQIDSDMKELSAEHAKKREELRRLCKWAYSVTSKKSLSSDHIYYTIVSVPEYVIQGDEKWYETHNHQQFFIVNNVIIINGSGYGFKKVNSGDTLTDFEISNLNKGIVPDLFIN